MSIKNCIKHSLMSTGGGHCNYYNLIYYSTLTLIIACTLAIIFNRLSIVSLNLDYWPINGTFQNFNVVRRFLSGQIPFYDFQVYLGLGHLFAGSFFTYIFGGNYSASIKAFHLLTMLSLAGYIFFLGMCILAGKKYKCFIVVSVIFLTFYLLMSSGNYLSKYSYLLAPGNSARLIRGGVLLLVGTILLFLNKKTGKTYGYLSSGILIGIFSLWSNDYGFASLLSVLFLLLIIQMLQKHCITNMLRNSISYCSGAVIGLFISAVLFSFGRPFDVFSTLQGIGSYQSWYYGVGAAGKPNYLYQIDKALITNIVLCCCVLYLIYLIFYNNVTYNARVEGPLFFATTCYIATQEYHLLSGGYSHNMNYVVVYSIIVFETINVLLYIYKQAKIFVLKNIKDCAVYEQIKTKHRLLISAFLIIMSFLVCFFTIRFLKPSFKLYQAGYIPSGVYNRELGGYLRARANDVVSSKKFIGNAKIFSTYASAAECVTNQYQPSGYDYIIHVLGNQARDEYFKIFKKGDFDYVTTIRDDFSWWERWVRNANWFFYKELYSNYHPVFATDYQIFWKRNHENYKYYKLPIKSIEVSNTSLPTSRLKIKSKNNITGIANARIKIKTNQKRKSLIQKFLTVNNYITLLNINDSVLLTKDGNNFNKFNLPCDDNTHEVPVIFKNGVAEIIINAYPAKQMEIEDVKIDVDYVYDTPFRYMCIDKVFASDNKIMLKVNNNTTDEIILNSIKFIKVGSYVLPVEHLKKVDKQIILTLNAENIKNKNEIIDKVQDNRIVYCSF